MFVNHSLGPSGRVPLAETAAARLFGDRFEIRAYRCKGQGLT